MTAKAKLHSKLGRFAIPLSNGVAMLELYYPLSESDYERIVNTWVLFSGVMAFELPEPVQVDEYTGYSYLPETPAQQATTHYP